MEKRPKVEEEAEVEGSGEISKNGKKKELVLTVSLSSAHMLIAQHPHAIGNELHTCSIRSSRHPRARRSKAKINPSRHESVLIDPTGSYPSSL